MDLKALRKEHKLTQTQLAKEIGVNLSTIANWEKGRHQISPKKLKKLERYFEKHKTIDELKFPYARKIKEFKKENEIASIHIAYLVGAYTSKVIEWELGLKNPSKLDAEILEYLFKKGVDLDYLKEIGR